MRAAINTFYSCFLYFFALNIIATVTIYGKFTKWYIYICFILFCESIRLEFMTKLCVIPHKSLQMVAALRGYSYFLAEMWTSHVNWCYICIFLIFLHRYFCIIFRQSLMASRMKIGGFWRRLHFHAVISWRAFAKNTQRKSMVFYIYYV